MDDAEILFERRGQLGLVTLNRPKALNALTYGMVLALDSRLSAWAADDRISAVAICGAGDKAFAAGGDIRALFDQGQGGRAGEKNFRFFWDEYRLNTRIKRYPKPYVALMDGIVMGGGVGVSIHGSLRIATERTMFAMPETGIGLFPDVGGAWFLPRLPGELGMWLALTGQRVRGRDTVRAGICDAMIGVERVDDLLDALADGVAPDGLDGAGLGLEFADGMPHPRRAEADAQFGGPNVEAVLAALAAAGTEWAEAQRSAILSKSPSSTRIAFRQIRAGAGLSFEDCMRMEYRLARYCMTTPDFYEGVRAVIIDKDNAPKWSPATLAEASEIHVAPAFENLGADELALP